MNEAILIWLFFTVRDLAFMLMILPILISTLIAMVLGASHLEVVEEVWKGDFTKAVIWWKRMAILFFIGVSLGVILPDKEDLKYIIGGAVVWNVATLEETQQLPENLVNAANTFLTEFNQEEETTNE